MGMLAAADINTAQILHQMTAPRLWRCMENLLGITGGALYNRYPPTHGLAHAGLTPEPPGDLSDDEDLSQICQTDDDPVSVIMLGEDWMS